MLGVINCTQDVINLASGALKNGRLVAFPTETVYGLGADASNEEAVRRIYSVKGRPSNHPLIIHILSINQINNWAVDVPEYAFKLAKKFWPGPMTLVVKKSDFTKEFVTGGQKTVALRVPSHPIAQAILTKCIDLGVFGIAAPSANKYGAVSPTTADSVVEEIGENLDLGDFILDGGQCSIGIESTIVDCSGAIPTILRSGSVTSEEVIKVTNIQSNFSPEKTNIRVPGLLNSHYSPKAKIILDRLPLPGEGFIALGSIPTPPGAIRLAAPESIQQYGIELYSALRMCDRLKLDSVSIVLPASGGLGKAIIDRIIKASFRGV